MRGTGITGTYNFNPHTREGCDGVLRPGALAAPYFNPHTREGCDGAGADPGRAQGDFNPHTREGCDEYGDFVNEQHIRFQSTHP